MAQILESAVVIALFAWPATILGAAPGTIPAPRPSPGQTLAGVTLDPRGLALAGVEIRFARIGSAGSPVLTVLSDAGGRFRLGSLAPGAYRLVAVKGGYSVLVGQIDTLVQDTLELVLRPSGPPGPPGTRPESSGWALRLPHRDVFEDRQQAAVADAGSPDERRRFYGIDALTTGGDSTGHSLAAEFLLLDGPEDSLVARVERMSEGSSDSGLSERLESARLARASGGSAPASVVLDFVRRRDQYTSEGGRQALEAATFGLDITRRFEAPRLAADVRIGVDLADLGGTDGATGSTNGDLVRAAVAASVNRIWGDAHEFRAEVNAAAARISADGGLDGDELVIIGAPGGLLDGALDAARGDAAAVSLIDRWSASPDVEVFARGRADWRRSDGGRVQGTATGGARWSPLAGLAVRAEAGLALGGVEAGTPIGAAGLEGSLPTMGWSVFHAREVGPGTWEGAADATAGAGLFFVGADAQIERWSVGLTWEPSPALPQVRVRAERLRLAGGAAPRYGEAIVIVPIDGDAQALGKRWELAVALSRLGTTLAILWDQIDQIGAGNDLLDGAESWERRAISLRQRLLGYRTGSCEFTLAVEDARLDWAGAVPETTLRLAMLDRRRITGGVALSF